ncbi:hypothetical protein, partial [Streptomyces sp. NPDC059008]|uniref:hypothetical protein n=1 Tax=Streptomyces sp. NPDC059008 TaxID=3346693 RepID=UPI0036CBA48E
GARAPGTHRAPGHARSPPKEGERHAVEADARSWRYGVKKMCGANGGRVMRLSGALPVPYGFCR